MKVDELDISTWAFSQDSNYYYSELRKKGNVHYVSKNNIYLVTGYNTAVEVLNNHQIFSSSGEHPFDPILLNCDPPKHTIHRKILAGGEAPFSSKRIELLSNDITSIANELINHLKSNSSFELMNDFAMPFSSLVILKLLGLNANYNEKLKKWTTTAVSSASIHNKKVAEKNWQELKPDLKKWISEAKQSKSHGGLNELIFHPYSQKNFNEDSIINLTKVLLLGGNETTPNLIASCLYRLLSNTQLINKIKENRQLVNQLINETLRIDAPTQIIQRTCTKDYVLDNSLIPKNSLVSISIGAANMDPSVFENATEFKLNRGGKILSFGYGPHYCIGAHLAKLETKIALNSLINSFPDIRLSRKDKLITHSHSSHVKAVEKLTLNCKQQAAPIRLSIIKQKAIKLIKKEQTSNGELPTYESYPSQHDVKKKNWHITQSSPFVHANILYSISTEKDLQKVFSKGVEFILQQKEIGDMWRFWKISKGINNVPIDVDDTAICSLVLEKNNYTLNNKKILHNNILKKGTIKTWIVPNKRLFLTNPPLYFKLILEKRHYRNSIKNNFLHPDDSELSVALNVLSYLKESTQTTSAISNCIELWEQRKINGDFYNNLMVTIFHIARAYKEGVVSLQKLIPEIVKNIEKNYQKLCFAELLLAALSLRYFEIKNELYDKIKTLILSITSEEDFKFHHFEYFTSKDRNFVAGSHCLTAAWFLELTSEWKD